MSRGHGHADFRDGDVMEYIERLYQDFLLAHERGSRDVFRKCLAYIQARDALQRPWEGR